KTCKQIEDDTSQKSFDTLATQKGWKQCPGCKFMVEKTAELMLVLNTLPPVCDVT
ncbi:hypothetical protein BGZ58_002171, partial [Dissophora ornata]